VIFFKPLIPKVFKNFRFITKRKFSDIKTSEVFETSEVLSGKFMDGYLNIDGNSEMVYTFLIKIIKQLNFIYYYDLKKKRQ